MEPKEGRNIKFRSKKSRRRKKRREAAKFRAKDANDFETHRAYDFQTAQHFKAKDGCTLRGEAL